MASQSDRLAQLLEAKKVFDKSAETIQQLVAAGVIDAARADAQQKKAKAILDNFRNAALQDNGQMSGDGVAHSPNKRKRTRISQTSLILRPKNRGDGLLHLTKGRVAYAARAVTTNARAHKPREVAPLLRSELMREGR